MKSRLSEITDKIMENKSLPILGLPPPIQDKNLEKSLTKFRNWVKRHAKAHSLKVIDFYGPFLDKRKRIIGANLEDGIHPSSKGYQAMAQAAIKTLKNLV